MSTDMPPTRENMHNIAMKGIYKKIKRAAGKRKFLVYIDFDDMRETSIEDIFEELREQDFYIETGSDLFIVSW